MTFYDFFFFVLIFTDKFNYHSLWWNQNVILILAQADIAQDRCVLVHTLKWGTHWSLTAEFWTDVSMQKSLVFSGQGSGLLIKSSGIHITKLSLMAKPLTLSVQECCIISKYNSSCFCLLLFEVQNSLRNLRIFCGSKVWAFSFFFFFLSFNRLMSFRKKKGEKKIWALFYPPTFFFITYKSSKGSMVSFIIMTGGESS